MKTKVLLLTNSYPYYPGEEFLIEEVNTWQSNRDIEFIIAPMNKLKKKRDISKDAVVNKLLVKRSLFEKLIALPQAFFSYLFWGEIENLFKRQRFSVKNLTLAYIEVCRVTFWKKKIKKLLSAEKDIKVIYTYWNTAGSYACALLKEEKYKEIYLVSRAHGYDLYEERKINSYMPLKRQFIEKYDLFVVLSKQARNYVQTTYGASGSNIRVIPLGVNTSLSTRNEEYFEKGHIRILSVSSCVDVKRIHLILELVSILSLSKKVDYTHVGGGALLEVLEKYGKELSVKSKNLKIDFTGYLENRDVQLVMAGGFDLMVNFSDSEGMPVSIMEAMDKGIPVIAPDIGGIASLLSVDKDFIFDKGASPEEVANKVIKLEPKIYNSEFRQQLHQHIYTSFNVKSNVEKLQNMIFEQLI